MVSHIGLLQSVLADVIDMVGDGITTQGGYIVSGRCYRCQYMDVFEKLVPLVFFLTTRLDQALE